MTWLSGLDPMLIWLRGDRLRPSRGPAPRKENATSELTIRYQSPSAGPKSAKSTLWGGIGKEYKCNPRRLAAAQIAGYEIYWNAPT